MSTKPALLHLAQLRHPSRLPCAAGDVPKGPQSEKPSGHREQGPYGTAPGVSRNPTAASAPADSKQPLATNQGPPRSQGDVPKGPQSERPISNRPEGPYGSGPGVSRMPSPAGGMEKKEEEEEGRAGTSGSGKGQGGLTERLAASKPASQAAEAAQSAGEAAKRGARKVEQAAQSAKDAAAGAGQAAASKATAAAQVGRGG